MNKEQSANTTLSHYRIAAKIGAGGMGEVWRAHDTRLNREVARINKGRIHVADKTNLKGTWL